MAKLPEEYVDRKAVHHRVEHVTRTPEDKAQRERILAELTYALTKSPPGEPGEKPTGKAVTHFAGSLCPQVGGA